MKTALTIAAVLFGGLLIKWFGGYELPYYAGYVFITAVVIVTCVIYFMQGASDITDTGFEGYKGSYKHGRDMAAQMAVQGAPRGKIEMELLKAVYPDEFKRGVRMFIKQEYKL